MKEQAETVQDIAAEFGGNSFEWATTPEASSSGGKGAMALASSSQTIGTG